MAEENRMETYIDIYFPVDGAKASVSFKKLLTMGLKPTVGDHDFVHKWKGIVTIEEEITFIESIQEELKGTGIILKFTTIR
jgi:hypothetical protein